MISTFIILYVLSEPFERFSGGRWSGIASLSSIVWLKNFDLEDEVMYGLEVSYALSSSICLRNGELSPSLFAMFNMLAPLQASTLVNMYIWYVYSLYQIYKMGETQFTVAY